MNEPKEDLKHFFSIFSSWCQLGGLSLGNFQTVVGQVFGGSWDEMVFGQIYKRLNRIYKMNSMVSVLIVVENAKTEITETYANKVFTKKIGVLY